jgi:excisionase family DNA binding protein
MNSSTTASLGECTRTEPHPAAPSGVGSTVFEPLLDSGEAAALLKIHPKTLQKLARNGKVDAIQIGKLWRFRASALNRWLEKIAR